MPLSDTILFLSGLIALALVVYQNPEPLLTPIIGSYAYDSIQQIFDQPQCYLSVKTNSDKLQQAQCFTVKDGRFKRVFVDEDSSKRATPGHVIPGLWDGHGHLLQLGELKNSVDLFGTNTMGEVHERLIEYKQLHATAGSSEEWLRGVGWDQAAFGKWPVAVCACTRLLSSLLRL